MHSHSYPLANDLPGTAMVAIEGRFASCGNGVDQNKEFCGTAEV